MVDAAYQHICRLHSALLLKFSNTEVPKSLSGQSVVLSISPRISVSLKDSRFLIFMVKMSLCGDVTCCDTGVVINTLHYRCGGRQGEDS